MKKHFFSKDKPKKQANNFADYLLENNLKTTEIKEKKLKKQVYYVQFAMSVDYRTQNQHKYGEYVRFDYQPKEKLFTPKTNIQYGTTYSNILFTRYLTGIANSLSHEYCVIAAYNTGSGNVLSVFDKDRTKAVQKINSMTSAEVYRKLRTSLKYEEARNYLHKVTNAKKEFQIQQSHMQNAESPINSIASLSLK